MTQNQPAGLSIQDKAIQDNYLDRIKTLEQEVEKLKSMLIVLSDRITALGG
jgi:hypothetical protein